MTSVKSTYDALLSGLPLFADLDAAERSAVARLLEPFSAAAGDTIFSQGAPPTGLYLVERGAVAVSARLFGGDEVTLVELGPGAAFGEIALVDRQPRSAGARAIQPTNGAFLAVNAFDGLRAWLHPSALKLVLRITRGLTERLRELYASMSSGTASAAAEALAQRRDATSDERWLRLLSPLSTFSEQELELFRSATHFYEVERGGLLARAGDPADEVFLVVRGALEVRAGARRVALLGPGALTSESSLIDAHPRTVDVLAREDASVLTVPVRAIEGWLSECSPLSFKIADALVRAVGHGVRAASRRRAQLSGEMHDLVVHTSSS